MQCSWPVLYLALVALTSSQSYECCSGDECCSGKDSGCGGGNLKIGDGDCDSDSNCAGDLRCGHDNCAREEHRWEGFDISCWPQLDLSGWDKTDDCCCRDDGEGGCTTISDEVVCAYAMQCCNASAGEGSGVGAAIVCVSRATSIAPGVGAAIACVCAVLAMTT